ncbi:unnamed protein product [Trichobilharzia regenti]|nr:unnamed protein product [Trichobilharzia regenti]
MIVVVAVTVAVGQKSSSSLSPPSLCSPEVLSSLDAFSANLLLFTCISSNLWETRCIYVIDGNGGLYRALNDRGILNDMKSRGIEYVQIYCVDNILVKLPDLHFIGFCIENSADCGAEVVQKLDPEEAIGVVGVVNGRYQLTYFGVTAVECSPTTHVGQGSIAGHRRTPKPR